MSRQIIAFGAAIFLFVIFEWIYFADWQDNELANKPEWSSLQIAEAKYRDDKTEGVMFIFADNKDQKFDLIGIKNSASGSRSWLIANPQRSPLVKILPLDVKIRISKEQLEKIITSVKLNQETQIFLKNSVQEWPKTVTPIK